MEPQFAKLMPASEKEHSPQYESPPVVETIFGVQFERLTRFGNAHLGAYWNSLDRTEWPNAFDAPPLESHFEVFPDSPRWSKGFQLKLSQNPSYRMQAKNATGDRMIQAQNGRLHYNLLGRNAEKYRRYPEVRLEFERVLVEFFGYVEREGLGRVRPNQWEVTYLNHIPKDTVWSSPRDWSFFKPLAEMPTIPGLIEGESFGGEWHFVIPPQLGRLHVQWRHGVNSDDPEKEMIVLTLTARGPLANDGAIAHILEGVDRGHRVIVNAFESLMSESANRYWGLKNGNS